MILASSLFSTWDSSEQVLLIRLEKQVSVLSQMPLKNMMDSKSSSKSVSLLWGSSLLMMARMFWPSCCLTSSARFMMSCLISMRALMCLPAWVSCWVTFSAICALTFSILALLWMVISSMQSRIEILALSDTMFRMCLLFTKSEFFMLGMMFSSDSVGWNGLPLSFFRGVRNSFTRSLSMMKFRNICSSSPNRNPRSFFSWLIFLISRLQSATSRSRSALLMIRITPFMISVKLLKDRSRFLVRRGSLSARDSVMWDSSIISTIFTLSQISSSLCTKKELEISYYSPLLSLKPGQSQNARFSMMALVGIEVSEYFSWPILMTEGPSQTSLGLRPSLLTVSWPPARKLRMVLLPTPVSPMTMTASWASSFLGMARMPFLISSFSLTKLSCSDIVKNIIMAVSPTLLLNPSLFNFIPAAPPSLAHLCRTGAPTRFVHLPTFRFQ